MRRCFVTRLTFQRLLCGDKLVLADDVAVQEAASAFRARYPVAPLPVPIAAALGRSCMIRGEPQRVISLLASHPSSHLVLQELIQILSCDDALESSSLLQLLVSARSLTLVMSCELLRSLAGRLAGAGMAKEVRKMIMSEVREASHLAGTLLRSLCEVSDPTIAEERQDVVDAFDIALQRSFISPRDYGLILGFLSRGGEHRKVMALWLWMRHSSARWDKTAASAIIISAALTKKMNVAISVIQSLAEANEDPTTEAQKYFVRFLASLFPPLTRYADQLVAHWHTESKLWTTDARNVGVELLFVHYHAKNYSRLQDYLVAADMSARAMGEEKGEEARQAILRLTGMPYILRHFSADVETEPWLQNLYASGLRMKDLGSHPKLLAALASLSRHQKDEKNFFETIGGVKILPECFDKAVTFVADDICFRNAEETLEFIKKMAVVLSQEVPRDVECWLQLLREK